MLLIEGMNVLALTGKLTEKQIDDQFTLFVKKLLCSSKKKKYIMVIRTYSA